MVIARARPVPAHPPRSARAAAARAGPCPAGAAHTCCGTCASGPWGWRSPDCCAGTTSVSTGAAGRGVRTDPGCPWRPTKRGGGPEPLPGAAAAPARPRCPAAPKFPVPRVGRRRLLQTRSRPPAPSGVLRDTPAPSLSCRVVTALLQGGPGPPGPPGASVRGSARPPPLLPRRNCCTPRSSREVGRRLKIAPVSAFRARRRAGSGFTGAELPEAGNNARRRLRDHGAAAVPAPWRCSRGSGKRSRRNALGAGRTARPLCPQVLRRVPAAPGCPRLHALARNCHFPSSSQRHF